MEVDKATTPDSSGENCNLPEQSFDSNVSEYGSSTTNSEVCNGEVTNSKVDGESNISSSNGSTAKSEPPKGNKFLISMLRSYVHDITCNNVDCMGSG